jgi:DNA-binding Lrp family transcriptional regulator
MTNRKFSDNKLLRLFKAGSSVKEIAQKLGVGAPAVCKRLKALKISITKDVTLRGAPKLVDNEFNAMTQLRKVNALINKELDHIEQEIDGAAGTERKDLQGQRLKHVAEVRKQISLVLEIAQVLYNVDEVKAFQEEVLTAIGEAAPEVRSAILQNLQRRKAIRSVLDMKV